MRKLLRRIIPSYDDAASPATRAACGRLASITGIACNVLLFAAKLTIGTLAGSVSITADAVNNLSDAGSSVITLIGLRLAARPADEEHPYGHARIEYLTGLAVAAIILLIGFELAKSSFDKILHPEEVSFSAALVIVLVLSIVLKLLLSAFHRSLGKHISSVSLLAAAADSRNDVISTAAVLICSIVGRFSGLLLDGYIGLLVALFILYSGVGIARETIAPLLGEAPTAELQQTVREHLLANPAILGIHDLMVHDYGPGQCFATVHAEMDAAADPLTSHEILDELERTMLEEHRVHLTIHYDPIAVGDPLTDALHTRVVSILRAIDPRLGLHDFRIVIGENRTNLIFDLVLPHDLYDRRLTIQQTIDQALQTDHMRYYTVITFDLASFN